MRIGDIATGGFTPEQQLACNFLNACLEKKHSLASASSQGLPPANQRPAGVARPSRDDPITSLAIQCLRSPLPLKDDWQALLAARRGQPVAVSDLAANVALPNSSTEKPLSLQEKSSQHFENPHEALRKNILNCSPQTLNKESEVGQKLFSVMKEAAEQSEAPQPFLDKLLTKLFKFEMTRMQGRSAGDNKQAVCENLVSLLKSPALKAWVESAFEEPQNEEQKDSVSHSAGRNSLAAGSQSADYHNETFQIDRASSACSGRSERASKTATKITQSGLSSEELLPLIAGSRSSLEKSRFGRTDSNPSIKNTVPKAIPNRAVSSVREPQLPPGYLERAAANSKLREAQNWLTVPKFSQPFTRVTSSLVELENAKRRKLASISLDLALGEQHSFGRCQVEQRTEAESPIVALGASEIAELMFTGTQSEEISAEPSILGLCHPEIEKPISTDMQSEEVLADLVNSCNPEPLALEPLFSEEEPVKTAETRLDTFVFAGLSGNSFNLPFKQSYSAEDAQEPTGSTAQPTVSTIDPEASTAFEKTPFLFSSREIPEAYSPNELGFFNIENPPIIPLPNDFPKDSVAAAPLLTGSTAVPSYDDLPDGSWINMLLSK